MKRSDFKTEEALQVYKERAKQYFHDQYHMPALYNQARVAGPVQLHTYELLEQMNGVLVEIRDLLKEGGKP